MIFLKIGVAFLTKQFVKKATIHLLRTAARLSSFSKKSGDLPSKAVLRCMGGDLTLIVMPGYDRASPRPSVASPPRGNMGPYVHECLCNILTLPKRKTHSEVILNGFIVEIVGVEPTTPCLQSRCSSQLSYTPMLGSPEQT